MWRTPPAPARPEGEPRGEAHVLAVADAMRASGGGAPHRLHYEAVAAFRRGEIEFDDVTRLYRHAMVHAGAIVRMGGAAFRVCPDCEARLGGRDNA